MDKTSSQGYLATELSLPSPSSHALSAQARLSPPGWQTQPGVVPVPMTPLCKGVR